jgi:DNA-binding GntR family transcriptional regulator
MYKNRTEQLADDLRAEIAAGDYDITGRIPSLTQLRDRSGLSLQSVQRVIGTLKREGLLYSVRGVGVFVKDRER